MTTALVMMTDPGNPEANGRMVHLMESAARFDAAGEDVKIWFHGAAVNWATAFVERSDPFTQHYGEKFESIKPLIGGACNFCANQRFDQASALATLGIAIVGEDGGHHSLADVALAGDRVFTF